MFGDDWFGGEERLALALVVDGRHSELILFTVVQTGHVTLRSPTVLADRCPLARLLVLLLHHVVTDRLAAVVLQDRVTATVINMATGHIATPCSEEWTHPMRLLIRPSQLS